MQNDETDLCIILRIHYWFLHEITQVPPPPVSLFSFSNSRDIKSSLHDCSKALRKILIASSPLCNTRLTNCHDAIREFVLLERSRSSSLADRIPMLRKGVRMASILNWSINSSKLSKIFLLTWSISVKSVSFVIFIQYKFHV